MPGLSLASSSVFQYFAGNISTSVLFIDLEKICCKRAVFVFAEFEFDFDRAGSVSAADFKESVASAEFCKGGVDVAGHCVFEGGILKRPEVVQPKRFQFHFAGFLVVVKKP